MKKLINLSCFLMLFIFQAQAEVIQEEPQFSVTVSQASVLLGNYIEVTFTLKNSSGSQFEAPKFEGFDIVSGPNQSSSFSMMNGVTTQSISYTYYIKPKEIGNLYVEPAFIDADGKTLETQPIEIIVLENPDGIIEKPQRRSQGNMDMFQFPSDDFFNFPDMDEFFNMPKIERVPRGNNQEEKKEKSKKPKKKRKVYKI